MTRFQDEVQAWVVKCFGETTAADVRELNFRFAEETLELVQSLGCTKDEVLQLVEYVYGRPAGEPRQEVGGVMITLAALCAANKIDMNLAGALELNRCHAKTEKIRLKHESKPLRAGPLPGKGTP